LSPSATCGCYWRERAQQFGLVPVTSEDEALPAVSTSPERLLHEEESEALADQPVLEAPGGDDTDPDDQEETEEAEPEGYSKPGRCRTKTRIWFECISVSSASDRC